MAALATHCASTLTELKLREIGLMEDSWLSTMSAFTNLTLLDLSFPAKSLNDEPVIQLLQAIGASLSSLNLSENSELTDAVLLRGIRPHTGKLTSLSLSKVELLTDLCVEEFFKSYNSNPALERINLSYNPNLSSNALTALLSHSGSALTELDINGWKATSNEVLLTLPEHASGLVKVDVGFCREVDDYVMKALLEGCEKITEIQCFGCNRVTINCPRKVRTHLLYYVSHGNSSVVICS